MNERKITCPICRKAIDKGCDQHRPFCSERCKLIDLGSWAAGDYRIPVDRTDPSADTQKEKSN
jgi:endogenous inhibitor of DNA gyrase (YacG/DUF329 family)